jgi:RNA polymerase sigma-70 factor, ECF subfamily
VPAETDRIVAELPRLRRFARALCADPGVADDLVQDCVERALGRLKMFRAGTNLRAWLFTIMRNIYISSLRAKSASGEGNMRSLDAEGAPLPVPANLDTPEAIMGARDIVHALEQLPLPQREVLVLVALEGMSYLETSQIIGVPTGTVMSRLARSREKLRQILNANPVPRTGLRSVK